MTVAFSFSAWENLEWILLDNCEKMVSRFQSNMRERKVKVTPIYGNAMSSISYDTIAPLSVSVTVASFVMSSLDHLPPFSAIYDSTMIGGILVITDGDPVYTMTEGIEYSISTDKEKHILTLNPWSPVKIIEKAMKSGFTLLHTNTIQKRQGKTNKKIDYSYILVFKKVSESNSFN